MSRDTFGPDFQAFADGVLESTKGDIAVGDLVENWKAAMDGDRSAPVSAP